MKPPVKAPEKPPPLLPGRSARGWMRIGVGALGGGMVIPVLIFLGAGLAQPFKDFVMAGSFLVGLGIGAVGAWAFVNSNGAVLRERDAGYTTLYGMFIHLWQLDPRTGEVLRRPGEREVRRRPRDEG